MDIISNSIRDVQAFLGASAPSTDAFSKQVHPLPFYPIFCIDCTTCSEDIIALFDKSFHALSTSSFLGNMNSDWSHEEQVEEQDCVGDVSTWTEDFSMDIKNLITAQDMRSASFTF